MRNHAQQEEDTEINMTPMLDIVFIMLIFFIVTAVFVKESGTTVIKPEAETAVSLKQVSVLIAVTEDDEIHINREVKELEEVRTAVEKLHAENPKGSVAIQSDETADAVLVMKVYDAIRDAGVEKIAIATEVK
ncbi:MULTISPECIES: ExbD/TolR family protein [Kordiimonas]|uniref:ExbD/TolR family protein n=1 Tax=Kordiimonas TaxID=288021 RepID=UPI001FF37447|nr:MULTISPECIES: biopolymer transporter ExbD [Kordiimonas]MCK0069121.1 biopolymer transporter ExbD [Kordiimonas laminariae]UTW58458.1 biopolymer transporter ExbD [Kordiimonas sp. SCSIO 12603]